MGSLAPARGRGMRRLGEPASHSRSWVRGNFHITLTPTLSLGEGEGVVALPLRVPSPPSGGEGQGERA